MKPAAAARLAAIVDSSFDAIVSKTLQSVVTSWNAAAERMFGYSSEEMIGRSILTIIPEHLQGEEDVIIARIGRGERVASYETVRRRKDGSLIHVSLTISPIKDRDGGIIGASKIARDITAAKESERRIALLLREVSHRVKNQFAVILSIIRETSNRAISPQQFEDQVRQRILALARSHDLLVNEEWTGAGIVHLVREHLKPFGCEERITLSGPLLTLAPHAVQYLGMAIHELGTNAAKYGALVGSEGRISVKWRINAKSCEEDELELVWDETFPSANKVDERTPSRRGFGRVVLERAAPGALDGSARWEQGPGRLRWALAIPMRSAVHIEVDDESWRS